MCQDPVVSVDSTGSSHVWALCQVSEGGLRSVAFPGFLIAGSIASPTTVYSQKAPGNLFHGPTWWQADVFTLGVLKI